MNEEKYLDYDIGMDKSTIISWDELLERIVDMYEDDDYPFDDESTDKAIKFITNDKIDRKLRFPVIQTLYIYENEKVTAL